MRVALFFPPGWTLVTGSPHVALPLLAGHLRAVGIDVWLRDLNIEAATAVGVKISGDSAGAGSAVGSLEAMNEPYFEAEDHLMKEARQFGGTWNAQLGFEFFDAPQRSSTQSVEAISRCSPFTQFFEQSVLPEVARRQPDIIGMSIASTYQLLPAFQLAHLLKTSGYEGFIVLGGNTITRLRRELAFPRLFDFVDGLVSFQGERPFERLCHGVEHVGSLDLVPNLIWRDDGRVRENPTSPPSHPDAAVVPDYRDLDLAQYWGTHHLNLVGERGCYYGQCSFCAIPYGWAEGGYAGGRSVSSVYDDIQVLIERHDTRRFKFVDEALSPRFMRQLAERLLRDDVRIEWEGYTRFEPAWSDAAFVELVGRAGFRKGYFGLEILNSAHRPSLRKGDAPRVETLLTLAQDAGVRVHFFCMFGFPGTSSDDAERTADFLLTHESVIDTADIFPWTFAKHTTVAGVEPVVKVGQDWDLEFDHRPTRAGVLSRSEILEMTERHEERLWACAPRLLHPLYRMTSPWTSDRFGHKERRGLNSIRGVGTAGDAATSQPTTSYTSSISR